MKRNKGKHKARHRKSSKAKARRRPGPFGNELRQLLYKAPFRINEPTWTPADLISHDEQHVSEPTEEPRQSGSSAGPVPEMREFYAVIADVATGLWRIRRRMVRDGNGEMPDETRKIFRHVESAWDNLSDRSVEVRDQTNEKYVSGMALKVIAFQPTPGTRSKMIAETIKPSIFYKDTLIQQGEVIVATPEVDAESDNAPDSPDEEQSAGRNS